MKLVRARPKAVEDLPEWAKCCTEQTEFQRAIGELVLDINDRCLAGPGACLFCGALTPSALSARIVSGEYTGRLFALCTADLDETGVPDGKYVEAVAP